MTYPMRRRNATGSSFDVSSPSISIRPDDGSTMRLIMRRSVVLPEPDDPTSTVVLRDGSTRLKSSTATVPSGNCFVTLTNSIIGAAHSSWATRIDTCRTVLPKHYSAGPSFRIGQHYEIETQGSWLDLGAHCAPRNVALLLRRSRGLRKTPKGSCGRWSELPARSARLPAR